MLDRPGPLSGVETDSIIPTAMSVGLTNCHVPAAGSASAIGRDFHMEEDNTEAEIATAGRGRNRARR